MAKQIIGLSEVSGSLVVYRNVEGVANEEVVAAESLRSKETKSLFRSLKEH